MVRKLPSGHEAGVLRWEHSEYNGKQYHLPLFDPAQPVCLVPNEAAAIHLRLTIPTDHPIIRGLNQPYDYAEFACARRPLSVGLVADAARPAFTAPCARVLDLPIKFPGSEVRLPATFRAFAPLLQQILDYELAINPTCYDEYYAYLTVDQGWVDHDELLREAPCHVDGFQGARWQPKQRCNHSYTVANCIPTVYYDQPFDFAGIDAAQYDFFWEMNCQVAATNSAHAWRPADWEITLMDGYTVHRGDEASMPAFRTFVRLSFETRIFDRLGNAHNPLFRYDWPMVVRDIESLHLRPWRPEADPTLICFPWQDPLTKQALPPGAPKTKPNLHPHGRR
jgi:hypothetical protein